MILYDGLAIRPSVSLKVPAGLNAWAQRGRYIDGEARQQLRGGLLAALELAVDDVSLAVEGQYRDLSDFRIDNPIFRNAGLGIFVAFRLQVAAAVIVARAHDFHHQVRTFPVFVGHSVRMVRAHEQDIRLAKFAGPQPDAHPAKKDFAEAQSEDECI